MKKTFLVFMLLLSAALLKAQPGGDKKEKIEAIKVGYITKQLDLTADEAKIFWPIYNQYD